MFILKYLLSSPQQPSVPTAGWYIVLTFFKKPLKTASGSTCSLCNQITYNLMNFFSEKQSPPTGFTAIWCQMPLKWNDVLWTPTSVLFAACLCLKSIVISHLQPLPPGILHPTGANSAELFPLCSIFPGTELQTVSWWSVPLPSTALLPSGTGCTAPLGSASIWELFDRGVSWHPRGTNLTRAPGQDEPSSFLSPAIFLDFCDLKPKVGQWQAAPGRYLSWVSISRGKSCSLPDEVVSFSQDLPQHSLPWVWIWHRACGTWTLTGRRLWWGCFGSGTCSESSTNLPAGAALGCWDGRDHPRGGYCRRGLSPHSNFFPHLHRCFLASLDAVGVMFHTLQWHSTERLPLKQARRRAGNRGE